MQFQNLFICSKCSAFISWDKIWGEKTRQAEAALCQVQENTAVANRIAFNLNREIVECGTQVEEVTSHA